ncbi:ABC transporter substrate-binding protein [uncultured Enterococcus sp.]|uniref:ABC transporter substrate-binding protein n=1 Tax=uncultured Enterococcus sp. TaxID=167972 RepID=UPI0025F8A772|nr:ABC transporter substrate-binding protein [uncultured Enterococcus sp.]
MKNWKKVLGLATVGLLTAGLAACGSSESSDSKKSDGGDTTLLMYQVGDKPENYDQLMEIANKRIKDKIGVTIDLQYIGWGDWDQKMTTIINSGEVYDIAFSSQYVANAQKGAFADLTDLSQKYAKEYMDELPEMYKKGNMVDGKLYAIPVYGNAWGQQVLTFNDQYVEKYNLDISKVDGSYESATEVLKQFHEKEPNIAAFAIGQSFKASGDFDYPLGKDYPFAVKLDESGTPKIINQYEDKDHQKTLKTLHEWYEAGLIPTDAATSSTSYPLEGNTWLMREETQGPMDYGDTILTNAANQPLTSRPLTPQLKTTSQAQMANFVVSNTSKNKEKSVEFLNLLNTDPELLNGLVWGVEGEAWEKQGDDHLKLLDGYKPNNHMSAWNTGNNMILYTQDTITDEMIKERDKSIEDAKESPILGFNFKTDKVKTELSNIANVMKRYASNLNTGSVDPEETLPKLNADLEKAGWSKVQTEMQTQLDDFVASNK